MSLGLLKMLSAKCVHTNHIYLIYMNKEDLGIKKPTMVDMP